MDYLKVTVLLIGAYILGSIPTALIISRRIRSIDIRKVGDGNMGARNAFHTIGSKYGILIAIIDILKGTLPVVVAALAGLNTNLCMLTGIAAIAGHDFPIFAHFKGGQGLATSSGVILALTWQIALIGFITYGLMYVITKKSTTSAAIAGGVLASILLITGQWFMLAYVVGILIFIPVKQYLDLPRRKSIKLNQGETK
jgi:glycerol-3-phosphate acyltransferase PlsY